MDRSFEEALEQVAALGAISDTEMISEENPPADEEDVPDDLDVLAILQQEFAAASGGGVNSTIATRRAEAMDGYLGNNPGAAREGYSNVVMRDRFEVVEWIMPDLLETFLSGDLLGRMQPQGAEDEAECKQQTDYTNYVMLRENPAFTIFTDAFKDSLLHQGIFKWWWESSEEVTYEDYENVTDAELAMVMEDSEVEIIGADPVPPIEIPNPETGEPVPLPLYNVRLKRTHRDGRARYMAVPGEEFLIDSDARCIKDARFVAHAPMNMTVSKLVALGYPREEIEDLPAFPTAGNDSEYEARTSLEDAAENSTTRDLRDDSERTVAYVEAYMRIDVDGDGISELMKICGAGYGDGITKILHAEPVREIPFSSICPIPIPHRFWGLGESEIVADLEKIHTAIARNFVDAMNLSNHPRFVGLAMAGTNTPMFDMDSLLSVVTGGVALEYAPNAIRPMVTEDISQKALLGMDWVRQVKEERTGVNRYTQGLEAPELNETLGGLKLLQAAANKRIKMISRIYAETGVKELMQGIAGLLKEHQRQKRIIRLRGEWIEADPTTWEHSYDCTIEVGLGYSDQAEKVTGAQTVLALQKEVSVSAPRLVTEANAYEAISELLIAQGFKNVERFFTDPKKLPAPEPQPTDEQLKLESVERMKVRELEVHEMEVRFDYEIELEKLKVDKIKLELERMKLQVEEHKIAADVQIAKEKAKEPKEKPSD